MGKGDIWYKYKPRKVLAFRFGYHETPQWFYDKVNSNEIELINDELCTIEVENHLQMVETVEIYKGDYVVLGAYGDVMNFTVNEFIRIFEEVYKEDVL